MTAVGCESPLYRSTSSPNLLNNFESLLSTPLEQAFGESIISQSPLPLLKQELQLKIQVRRLKEGKPELVLEDERPKTYQLTEEEEKKKNARLQQNRDSAVRSRLREKEREEKLRKSVNESIRLQRDLTKNVRELKKLRQSIMEKLKHHLKVCPHRESLKTALKQFGNMAD